MPQGRIVCPVDREAMHQFWDAALNRFKAYVESVEATTQSTANASHFQRRPSDRAEGGK
jgi:hypothetical protein